MEKKNKVMKHGSLFSGIGGFDLAADWMEWQNVFHCECEDFPRKVLHHYWPNAISHGDITKTDFTIYRGTIDILSGGFPCQPYSQAGKRLGKEDERHLWPHMLRAIREIHPRWVVGENVLGLVNWNDGLVFEEVCADLESEGYEVQPFILPAAGVNAPHQRYRVWFVAHSANSYASKQRQGNRWQHRDKRERREKVWGQLRNIGISRPTSDTVIQRNTSQRQSRGTEEVRSLNNAIKEERRHSAEWINGFSGLEQFTPDTCNEGLQGGEQFREHQKENSKWRTSAYGSASQLYTSNNWENFPTQSPICSGNDGIPGKLDGITFPKWRTESIKAYGNAVVPQVVLQIFKAIQEYENLSHGEI